MPPQMATRSEPWRRENTGALRPCDEDSCGGVERIRVAVNGEEDDHATQRKLEALARLIENAETEVTRALPTPDRGAILGSVDA